jgi:hypothetical protein
VVKYSHPDGLQAYSMAETVDGWMVAATVAAGSKQRAAWLRLDSKGTLLHMRVSKLQGAAWGVARLDKELWALSGATNPSGGNDNAAIFAVDGYGNRQWLREVDGGGADHGLSIARDSVGNLVVGGRRDVGGNVAG